LLIQPNILNNARAARSDRDFILRTIERTRKLTGEEAQLWRFAKARWLLNGPAKEKSKDSAEAVGILSDLVRSSPDVPQYRERLAAGLLNLGNARDAIDHLKAAVVIEPDDFNTVQELIRLLQAQNR